MIIFYNKDTKDCVFGISRDKINNNILNDYIIILGLSTSNNNIIFDSDIMADNANNLDYISAPIQSIFKDMGEGYRFKNLSEIQKYTSDEKWVQIREWRNIRLEDVDWVMLSDSKSKQVKAVEKYRQRLRDIPQSISNSDLFDVTKYTSV